jgi:hypothetical protein
MSTGVQQQPVPTHLDPIGAIIYYICVTEAKRSGNWAIPSSHKIALMLNGTDNKPNAQVEHLWSDLQSIIDGKFLFDERTHHEKRYHPLLHHALTQRNVNERIRNFYPAFNPSEEHAKEAQQHEKHHRQRYMESREFVDKKITAIRLIAFKDLYYMTDSRVTLRLAFETLNAQGFANADEYFGEGGFLSIMHRIRYIDFPGLQRGEEFSERHKNDPLYVEPGTVFRAQDMYLELRALDHFHELNIPDQATASRERSNLVSRLRARTRLRENVRRFIVEKHPTLARPGL